MANAFLHIPKIRACSIGALLAAGLLWPAQGHACSLLPSKMEQAICDMEDRAKAQQYELERLNDRVKEMKAAQDREYVQRSIADELRRRDEDREAWRRDHR